MQLQASLRETWGWSGQSTCDQRRSPALPTHRFSSLPESQVRPLLGEGEQGLQEARGQGWTVSSARGLEVKDGGEVLITDLVSGT